MSSLLIGLFLTLALTSASRAEYERRQFVEGLRAPKRNKVDGCAEVSKHCFSTSHCCDGLVCVSVDDYFGEKPEVPGSCVKEKELQECRDNSDCEPGTRCTALGRTSDQRYCTPGARRAVEPSHHVARVNSPADASKGSLGSSCQTSVECRQFTNDGQDELCCKDVHRGRLGIRRQCDRAESMGACIGPRY